MTKEHILQIAIGVDDDAIINAVSAKAEAQIIKELQCQVANRVFAPKSYYYNSSNNADPKTDPLSEFSVNLVKEFLTENKQEILDKAAVVLAGKLARSKAGKDLLTSVVGEGD